MRLPSWELTYWMAFNQIEPIKSPSWCAALVASAVWNSHKYGFKQQVGPEDLLPLGAAYRAEIDRERGLGRAQQLRQQAVINEMNREIALAMQGVPPKPKPGEPGEPGASASEPGSGASEPGASEPGASEPGASEPTDTHRQQPTDGGSK